MTRLKRHHWTGLRSSFIFIAGVLSAACAGPTATEPAQSPFGDVRVQGVVLLQDRASDLERKLGAPACLITGHPARTLYVYRTDEGNVLGFSINTASAHVDVGKLDGVSMMERQALPPACQKILPTSAVPRSVPSDSHHGLRLGDSVDRIVQRYGRPDTVSTHGNQVRMIYGREQGFDHHLRWTLDFQDDRLIEWKVEAFPVFYELAG